MFSDEESSGLYGFLHVIVHSATGFKESASKYCVCVFTLVQLTALSPVSTTNVQHVFEGIVSLGVTTCFMHLNVISTRLWTAGERDRSREREIVGWKKPHVQLDRHIGQVDG